MTKKTKQCYRASKHLYSMLHSETTGTVPKTIRRHIRRCNFCREKLIALQTEGLTSIDKIAETEQAPPMTEAERVDIKGKSLFVRIKTKILAILLPSKRQG